MQMMNKLKLRVAILDLYEGHANEGMRCIRDLLTQYEEKNNLVITRDEFDVRLKEELPGLDYDIYISSGGPGSPLESEGTEWERKFFNWISQVYDFNLQPENVYKKHVLFICHSYQLACRYFNIGNVTQRKSTAFGVFPVHLMDDGSAEPVFDGLKDPFYAVDSRDYQVIQPDHKSIGSLGASILALEKERPHVPLERALMAIRFNPFMIGTQFHPEADATGMSMYLQREDKKQSVIENHGYEKWESMIHQLNDPDKICWTSSHVIPNFLDTAIDQYIFVTSSN